MKLLDVEVDTALLIAVSAFVAGFCFGCIATVCLHKPTRDLTR